MNYCISNLEMYLPEKVITNKYLNETFGIDGNFLENKIGIKERRIASENQTTSDLAFQSATLLLDSCNTGRESIDLLIVCTQNPDYKLPTTACILQHKLKLSRSCMAFDINLGCSGFVYSLVVAGSMVKSGIANKALIVMADEYSKIIDYADKNTASLFGDASTAALIEKCDEGYGVISSNFGTDGSGAELLIANNSGTCKSPEKNSFLYMNGREIFKFSITEVPKSVEDLLAKSDLKKQDIKYFIFHQANKYMLNEIKKKIGITDEQLAIHMEMYGNTVSSSIPIVLKNLRDTNKIEKGDLLVFSGFGVGLSWGSILYREC